MNKSSGRSPDFVLIGAMKCATSTLHDQLAGQSGLWMSDPKEPNFFSDPQVWARGFSWYHGLFGGAAPDTLCGESSTHYTKLPTYPECADRIHEALPDAKLIYVMRNPVDRIISHYIHDWSTLMIDDGVTLDEAIHKHPILVEYSMYHAQLLPYFSLYGSRRILPVFLERLRLNPQSELERVCRHIGHEGAVCWSQTSGQKNASVDRQRRGPILNAILGVPAIQRLRRSLLPARMRGRLKKRWMLKERPSLSVESSTFLQTKLDVDLANLGTMLGIELDCNNFATVVTAGSAPEWASGPAEDA